MSPEPFRVGEVVAWWEPDIPLVRLLSVDMDTGLFEGEFVDRPAKKLTQDIDSICHRTPAYERWSAVLRERFVASGVLPGDATAEARQQAWLDAMSEEADLWLAVKREHPILGLG